MDIQFRDKREVWRGRGHPRREIPEEVRRIANATYRTGKVGTVAVGPDDGEDVAELCRLLRSYAKSLGRRMRIQQDEDELRFELVDRTPRKVSA